MAYAVWIYELGGMLGSDDNVDEVLDLGERVRRGREMLRSKYGSPSIATLSNGLHPEQAHYEVRIAPKDEGLLEVMLRDLLQIIGEPSATGRIDDGGITARLLEEKGKKLVPDTKGRGREFFVIPQ
jgi:hypothetical protein